MSEPSSALAHGLPNAVTSHLTDDLVSQQIFTSRTFCQLLGTVVNTPPALGH